MRRRSLGTHGHIVLARQRTNEPHSESHILCASITCVACTTLHTRLNSQSPSSTGSAKDTKNKILERLGSLRSARHLAGLVRDRRHRRHNVLRLAHGRRLRRNTCLSLVSV
jgi:hypothetical protein